MTLDELDKAATLSWRNLYVGNFAEALEEGTQFILGNVSGETANEDSGVVWVRELIHWLGSTVVAKRGRSTHRVHAWSHAATTHSTAHWHASRSTSTGLVLRGGGRDAHGTVAAVDTLHLSQSALLITLISESDEAIATRHARDRVGHNFCTLAAWETSLEEGDENVLVYLGPEITDKDREFWTSLIPIKVSYMALLLIEE
jgi:hypothetical protein